MKKLIKMIKVGFKNQLVQDYGSQVLFSQKNKTKSNYLAATFFYKNLYEQIEFISEKPTIDFVLLSRFITGFSMIFIIVFLYATIKKNDVLLFQVRLGFIFFLLLILKNLKEMYSLINNNTPLNRGISIQAPEIWVNSGQLIICAFFIVMLIITILLFIIKPVLQVESPIQKWKDIIIVIHLNLFWILIFYYDIIILTLTLEALSLTTIILLLSRCNLKIESVIKYFVPSAISTSIIVCGISIIFWKEQTVTYDEINYLFHETFDNPDKTISLLDVYVVTLISLGFMVKIGLFPFHAWAIDTLNGLGTAVLFYISVPYKLIVLLVSLKFFNMLGFFTSGHIFSIYLMYFLILGCLFLGNIGAWNSLTFNRFIGYTSLNNLGYFFLLAFTNEPQLLTSIILYIFIYAIGSGLFFLVLSRYDLRPLAIEGIFKNAPNLYCFSLLTIAVLSLAGIPPFGGFWAKMMLLSNLYINKEYFLMISIIFSSALSIVYYAKVLFPIWTRGATLLILRSYPNVDFIQFIDISTKLKNNRKLPSFIKNVFAFHQDFVIVLLASFITFSMFCLPELELLSKSAGFAIAYYKWQSSTIVLPQVIYDCIGSIFLKPVDSLVNLFPHFQKKWDDSLQYLLHLVQINRLGISDFKIWLEVYKANGGNATEQNGHVFRLLVSPSGYNFVRFMEYQDNFMKYVNSKTYMGIDTPYTRLKTFWSTVHNCLYKDFELELHTMSLRLRGLDDFQFAYFSEWNFPYHNILIENFLGWEFVKKYGSRESLEIYEKTGEIVNDFGLTQVQVLYEIIPSFFGPDTKYGKYDPVFWDFFSKNYPLLAESTFGWTDKTCPPIQFKIGMGQHQQSIDWMRGPVKCFGVPEFKTVWSCE